MSNRRMTQDDNSEKIEEITTDTNNREISSDTNNGDTSSDIISTEINGSKPPPTTSDNKSAFSLLLIPTLLFKFTIVLCIKFATDIVAYPMLWTYRLVRLGKRKIVRGINTLFRRGGEEKKKINGSSVNGNSGAAAKAGVNGDSASS